MGFESTEMVKKIKLMDALSGYVSLKCQLNSLGLSFYGVLCPCCLKTHIAERKINSHTLLGQGKQSRHLPLDACVQYIGRM